MKKLPHKLGRQVPHKVAVLAYDGLCLYEFATVLEILRDRAPSIRGWYDVRVASIDGSRVRSDSGVLVDVGGDAAPLSDADTIVIPGWRAGPVPDDLCEALRVAHRRGARLVSICTGAFAIAATGLLNGRRATTHWRHADALASQYPLIDVDPDVLYVDEGDILTSAGSSAGTDLMLHLVSNDFGAVICNQIARGMVTPPHREGGQAQFIETPVLQEQGDQLASILVQLRRNPVAEYTVEALARQASMSPRTFHRKFRAVTGNTPLDWLLIERTRLARELLETSDLSIDRIAEQTGFAAADTFRHHFRRIVGTTPSKYRATFVPPRATSQRRASAGS
ncbi:helix-turn-helix domain-containing protein [Lysobacter yangpyeongensis]|uniref:Helix-turn-helix domain-containing protein n=1 Tax=Lysobacter yangpyeongensis TaxID=346182 RepID=A0ABW0SHN2_9GAMM